MGWVLNATLRPLYPRKRDPVPTIQEAGWTSKPVWTGAENLAPTGIRSPDHLARIESLHRLSYGGPPTFSLTCIIILLCLSACLSAWRHTDRSTAERVTTQENTNSNIHRLRFELMIFVFQR